MERTPTSLKEGWAKIFGFLPPAGYAALRSLFGGTSLGWSGGRDIHRRTHLLPLMMRPSK